MKGFGLLFFVLLYGMGVNAQDQTENSKKSSVLIGFQTGLTYTTMDGGQIELETSDQGAKNKKGLGLELAFRLKYEFSGLVYFKSGIGYFQKNGKVKGSGFKYPTHGPFNFLQMPVIFGIQPFNLSKSNNFNLGIETGLAMNYLVSSNDNLEKGLHPNNEVERNSIVPSFQLGINFELPIKGDMFLTINYQYSKDLTYYFNRRYTWYSSQLESETYRDYDLWFRSQSISAGLLFKMGK